jgi:hypothetical protein
MGACGYVMSCHALNVAASRGPSAGRAYPGAESPWANRLDVQVRPRLGREVEHADR